MTVASVCAPLCGRLEPFGQAGPLHRTAEFNEAAGAIAAVLHPGSCVGSGACGLIPPQCPMIWRRAFVVACSSRRSVTRADRLGAVFPAKDAVALSAATASFALGSALVPSTGASSQHASRVSVSSVSAPVAETGSLASTRRGPRASMLLLDLEDYSNAFATTGARQRASSSEGRTARGTCTSSSQNDPLPSRAKIKGLLSSSL